MIFSVKLMNPFNYEMNVTAMTMIRNKQSLLFIQITLHSLYQYLHFAWNHTQPKNDWPLCVIFRLQFREQIQSHLIFKISHFRSNLMKEKKKKMIASLKYLSETLSLAFAGFSWAINAEHFMNARIN